MSDQRFLKVLQIFHQGLKLIVALLEKEIEELKALLNPKSNN